MHPKLEDLTHNHEVNTRKIERKILRVNVKRKAHEDVSARQSKVHRYKKNNFRNSAQFIHF